MKKIFLTFLLMLGICGSAFANDGEDTSSNIFKKMGKNDKAAILMVHFGTTYDETRVNTLDTINMEVRNKYPKIEVREAYTSRIIMRRLKKRLIFKDNPTEALDKLLKDGYTHIVVQSTNIINGVEAETLKTQLDGYKDKFKEIRISTPLLTTPEDFKEVSTIINNQVGNLENNEAVVLVGHGTSHIGNMAYPAMDYTSKSIGHKFYVGTIEGFPEFDDVVKALKKDKVEKVILMPFMFVAGDHANNDIAGEWKEDLEKACFEVDVRLISLGMIEDIRQVFMKHLDFTIQNEKEDMVAKKVIYSKQND